MKCVAQDHSSCSKVIETLIVEDPNHVVKYGFSGRYSICKIHVDVHIRWFKKLKSMLIDENKELTDDERRQKSFEFKSRCPICGMDLKNQPKWYFGFISETNGHRFATSTCNRCGKNALQSLGIEKIVETGMVPLDKMMI